MTFYSSNTGSAHAQFGSGVVRHIAGRVMQQSASLFFKNKLFSIARHILIVR